MVAVRETVPRRSAPYIRLDHRRRHTVAKIRDFTTRYSSNDAYVSPTRGQQGNAMQTIMAMTYLLDDGEIKRGETIIESRGVKHVVIFEIDHVRRTPQPIYRQENSPVATGTRITVQWPVCASTDLLLAKYRVDSWRVTDASGDLIDEDNVGWDADLTFTATRWQLYEGSLVGVPADIDSAVRKLGGNSDNTIDDVRQRMESRQHMAGIDQIDNIRARMLWRQRMHDLQQAAFGGDRMN
jgi:Na+-translocating ferredoxin:NAD+ oxidoreductase RnfG subunit